MREKVGLREVIEPVTSIRVLLDLMQRNVDLNFHQHVGSEANPATSACPVQVAELDWGGELPSGIPHEPDLILAADCVYFEVSKSASLVPGGDADSDISHFP